MPTRAALPSAACIWGYSITTPVKAERPLPSTPEQLQNVKMQELTYDDHVTMGSNASMTMSTWAPCTHAPVTAGVVPIRAVKPTATRTSVL